MVTPENAGAVLPQETSARMVEDWADPARRRNVADRRDERHRERQPHTEQPDHTDPAGGMVHVIRHRRAQATTESGIGVIGA
jgi:hypothetical protein